MSLGNKYSLHDAQGDAVLFIEERGKLLQATKPIHVYFDEAKTMEALRIEPEEVEDLTHYGVFDVPNARKVGLVGDDGGDFFRDQSV